MRGPPMRSASMLMTPKRERGPSTRNVDSGSVAALSIAGIRSSIMSCCSNRRASGWRSRLLGPDHDAAAAAQAALELRRHFGTCVHLNTCDFPWVDKSVDVVRTQIPHVLPVEEKVRNAVVAEVAAHRELCVTERGPLDLKPGHGAKEVGRHQRASPRDVFLRDVAPHSATAAIDKSSDVTTPDPSRHDPDRVEHCPQRRQRYPNGRRSGNGIYRATLRVVSHRTHLQHPRASWCIAKCPFAALIGPRLRASDDSHHRVRDRLAAQPRHYHAAQSYISNDQSTRLTNHWGARSRFRDGNRPRRPEIQVTANESVRRKRNF